MGIYIFNKKTLFELLAGYPEEHDFGKGIFPKAINTRRIHRYAYEGYWEDIGTVRSYFEASMSLLGERPPFSFYDFEMPVYTHHRNLPVPKLFDSRIDASLICDGSMISGGTIRRSIIGIRTYIRPRAEIDHAIVMGNDYYPDGFFSLSAEERERSSFGWRSGVKVERTIIDKNVAIGSNSVIQGSTDASITVINDENAKFHIINGIVVIPRGAALPDNTVIKADDHK
jgi:glucose-1-phosphate adenylyltransferase